MLDSGNPVLFKSPLVTIDATQPSNGRDEKQKRWREGKKSTSLTEEVKQHGQKQKTTGQREQTPRL